MKCQFIIFLLFLLPALWACDGTEVGNGRSRPDRPPSKRGPVGDSSPIGNTNDEVATIAERHLLAPCASPLAEAGTGVYKTATGENFEVQASSEGSVVFAFGKVLVKSAATTEKPYAVQIENWNSSLSCTATESEMQTRKVTYSDGYVVKWTVDGSGLTEAIQVIDDKGKNIAEYAKAP